jgi:hypothetical protein
MLITKKRREASSFTTGMDRRWGRAGLDAQAANQTLVVPEPSMGEGNTSTITAFNFAGE